MQTDDENRFYGVMLERSDELSEVLSANNDKRSIAVGEGNQINIYSPESNYLGEIKNDSQFHGINHFEIDNQNNLYVLDMNFARLRKFRPVGLF